MRVIKVIARVECRCDRCGDLCERLSVADVLEDGRIGDGEKPSGEIICNRCEKIIRAEENRLLEVARQRRRWAKGMVTGD